MRYISQALEEALASGAIFPAFKILAYDPTQDTIGDVVAGNATQTPLDLMPYTSGVEWSTDKLSLVVTDPDGDFNPDLGASRAYLQNGAIIRLIEGDERVPEDQWIASFTGTIRGQIGWSCNRATGAMRSMITVYNRAHNQAYNRRSIVTDEYTIGDDLGTMLFDVATELMGLTEEEIRIPAVLGAQFKHKTNQLVEVSPWEGLEAILETVAQVPYFDGDGRLNSWSKDLTRPVAKYLPDYVQVREYDFPQKDMDAINVVRVNFLGAELEKIPSPYQRLGSVQITAGFFKLNQVVKTWWSEDHRQRAEETTMIVRESCNTTIGRLYWMHDVFEEAYQQIDEYHGAVVVTCSIYVPILATVALAEYLVLAAVGDYVPSTTVGGLTIPWGRIAQAGALVQILAIMMSLGTGQYDIEGVPYDYVYPKRFAEARVEGIQYWEENRLEIDNDFIGTQDRADGLATLLLTWEQSAGRPRKLEITNDLSLEEGDIIALPDKRKFLIQKMSKKLTPGEVPLLTIEGFKVLVA